jgi:ATP synthase F1 gamma subunit
MESGRDEFARPFNVYFKGDFHVFEAAPVAQKNRDSGGHKSEECVEAINLNVLSIIFASDWVQKFYENVKPEEPSSVVATDIVPEKRKLIIAISSDRGLCGGIHSGIAKVIKKDVQDDPTVRIACVGDKIRSILGRYCGEQILFACNNIGRLPPTFDDARRVAQALMKTDYQFSEGAIYYNYFKCV